MGASGKDQPLLISVEDNELVIRIGIDVLAFADKERREWEGQKGYNVTDTLQFAKDVVRELERDQENGATLITDILDAAMGSHEPWCLMPENAE